MSDAVEPVEEESLPPLTKSEKRQRERIDTRLAALVMVADQQLEVDINEGFYSMTLNVGGQQISGQVVPEWLWAESVADAEGSSEGVRALFLSWSDKLRTDPQSGLPDFIHLSKVKFTTGNYHAKLPKSVVWRGRLDAVDGWIWGAIGDPTG